MTPDTLSARLRLGMDAMHWQPAVLARMSQTTEATISNWLNDRVRREHVKAEQLFRISKALRINPEWLLDGAGEMQGPAYTWLADESPSHPVKLTTLTIALRLAAEALDEREHDLPIPKRVELTTLIYELLEEGLPEAKVLKFARAAAA